MSAERLREAAAEMRRSQEQYAEGYEDKFIVAIADWLDATARELDALGNPDLSAHPQDGRRTAALGVANAYLGGDS